MRRMTEGSKVIVEFNGSDYIGFITHCFINVLISDVSVELGDPLDPLEPHALCVVVAAPGIDRLDSIIEEFNGNKRFVFAEGPVTTQVS